MVVLRFGRPVSKSVGLPVACLWPAYGLSGHFTGLTLLPLWTHYLLVLTVLNTLTGLIPTFGRHHPPSPRLLPLDSQPSWIHYPTEATYPTVSLPRCHPTYLDNCKSHCHPLVPGLTPP